MACFLSFACTVSLFEQNNFYLKVSIDFFFLNALRFFNTVAIAEAMVADCFCSIGSPVPSLLPSFSPHPLRVISLK